MAERMIFETPNFHPKSQPFIDHVFNFSIEDNRIWFRNYQIVEETGQIEEIGPRFVLEPIKIFEGSFGGPVLYENPEYQTPSLLRRQLRQATSGKYEHKLLARKALKTARDENPETFPFDPTDSVFDTRGSLKPQTAADEKDDATGEDQIATLAKDIEAKHPKKNKKKRKRKNAANAGNTGHGDDNDGETVAKIAK